MRGGDGRRGLFILDRAPRAPSFIRRRESQVETIERIDEWRIRYGRWLQESRSARSAGGGVEDVGDDYPFVENRRAPFVPLRRALPMLNLALITSAGAYIDGTEPFDTGAVGGDVNFREIPVEVEAEDLRFAARGYDPAAVREDVNVQVPIARLFEFESNSIIGQLNSVFWSFCGFIPDASRLAEEALPRLVERVKRYEARAALLVPASRLCHQSMALVTRALESAGITAIMIAVEREVTERTRPPRAAYYEGRFGSVVGRPRWPEHQRRVLDETLRLLEPMDQPAVHKLTVELETKVQIERGEK
jgi:D-proline reductase (dithiol) PrdB